jgi:hypothetical protein
MPQGEKKVQIGGCRIRTVGTLLNEVEWILSTPRASSNLVPPTTAKIMFKLSEDIIRGHTANKQILIMVGYVNKRSLFT